MQFGDTKLGYVAFSAVKNIYLLKPKYLTKKSQYILNTKFYL